MHWLLAKKNHNIASNYHERIPNAIIGSYMVSGPPKERCPNCGNITISKTCVEHDSQDKSKDLWICLDCYSAVCSLWKKYYPKKMLEWPPKAPKDVLIA